MDKETFKKTEGKLYGYFRDLKEMELLEIDCRELQDQEESIQWDIKHCNVYVSPDSHMSPSFSERVQTSPTGESVAEKGIVREIEKLEDELEYVSGKLRRNRARIRQLKRNIAPLKKVLTVPPLSKEMMDFVIYKYKINKSINWIANEMYGGVRSTAYRRRGEILEDIVKWESLYNDN
ncbi:transcriptional regulator [Clostridium sp. Mt-5]|uniref:Transcriptional regulator n=1 Tax=Clostridium moutaii TaxID=3240932 RepID=A0ABV4BK58_9CLOT